MNALLEVLLLGRFEERELTIGQDEQCQEIRHKVPEELMGGCLKSCTH